MQSFETLSLMVSAALGGTKGDESSSAVPETADQLEAVLARALG
jgi:hypothetical protein